MYMYIYIYVLPTKHSIQTFANHPQLLVDQVLLTMDLPIYKLPTNLYTCVVP